MNKELLEALNILEKENNISKETLLEAIENSLLTACKNHFGKADNVKVSINRDTCDFNVFAEKEVVETVEDPLLQISLADAKMANPKYEVGDVIHCQIDSKKFGRIATQNAKNVILQKIREEGRKSLFNDWTCQEREVVTGIVQRYLGRNVSINLGKVDAILNETEMVRSEVFKATERIKVLVLEVKDTPKGPRISVSRTHPDLVKRLFESEVTEVKDGTVEIKAIAREAGSRTKIAVKSNEVNVDPVGACVGLNGARVNSIVNELRGEKIDIISWDDNPAYLIENALSPAKVICVVADEESKEAQVIVPDYQLSLAIGKEGQNARLAARLTGYKIDIKSETQARELGLFEELGLEYQDASTSFEDFRNEYQEGGDKEVSDYQEEYQSGSPEDSQDGNNQE
ncbi:transcription termination factor NusA [Lacrimispora algidixylanolytica]|jgi:N utilization substance protein A|uniref:Transcription termination/antitermination protein NusA n=1 Tax=Lacrimispora algidixylanolytica TaxID=94868 RepID=A0A419SYS5_9FIRM|nr:transcription termination factor NusA [Lacrimispora algidixylanolytica]RKD30417.1 transcription termination/antitermination protein NusA [Lacrimispora algidixylanolytica]